jgi:hypothetical protein
MPTPSNAQFAAIAQWVNYAYDISANSTPGGPIPILPPGFPADYTLIAFIQASDDFFGFPSEAYYGYVAHSPTNHHVVVAIRGTYFVVEWLIDLDAPFVKFIPTLGNRRGIVRAGHAEQGFYGVYSTLAFLDPLGNSVDLIDFLRATVGGDPATTIDFVAHSLGGPITAMLASSVGFFAPSLIAPSTVTTFAAPAPGDQRFADLFYDRFAPTTYRIWNGLDPVPTALAVFDYAQVPEPGISVTPTWEQLEGYDFLSVYCNHSLLTYQWLLDNSYALASGCGPLLAAAAVAGSVRQQQIAAVRRRAQLKSAGPKT